MHINMVAPYQGLIEEVCEPRGGVAQSTGKAWKTVQFTLKYLDHQMQEQLITFDLSGPEKVDQLMSLPIGTEIRVAWRPATRRYQDQQTGKVSYFPSFAAFAFRVIPPEERTRPLPDQRPAQQPPQQPAYSPSYAQPTYQQPVYDQGPTDDLPI